MRAALPRFFNQTRHIDFQIAQMPAHRFCLGPIRLAFREPRHGRRQPILRIGNTAHQRVIGAHLFGQHGHAFGQRHQRLGCGGTPILATRDGGLQGFEIFRGLLKQCLDIGGHAAFAFLAQNAGRKPRQPGQPFFQIIEETVLRLPRRQVQKPNHQRAGKAKHGGRKRRAHPLQGFRKPGLQLLKQHIQIAGADRHAPDHIRNGRNGQQQPPESAKQAQENQQARHVARKLAPFIKPRLQPIQHAPHRGG